MERQYLTDSNVVIDYLSGRLTEKGKAFMNKVINEIPILSVITKIEVLGYNTSAEATQLLSQFINDSIIVGLSDKIVDKTIEVYFGLLSRLLRFWFWDKVFLLRKQKTLFFSSTFVKMPP